MLVETTEYADFDEAYRVSHAPPVFLPPPVLRPGQGFINSYPIVTPAGQNGDYFVNTYYLQPNRKAELVGPVSVRSGDCRPSLLRKLA